MKKSMHLMIILFGVMTLLSACGGGGGGGGTPPAAVTKASLKLITSGTGTIYGIDVTVNLAPGVTVKSTTPPQVDTDVVAPSGAAAADTIATAVYTAATGTLPGKVRILVANANGFTIGEFCSMNGDIASGHSPKSEDFSLESFSASDADGNVINGLTPGFTALFL